MPTRRDFGLMLGVAAVGMTAGRSAANPMTIGATGTSELKYSSSALGDYIFLLVFRPEKPRLPVFDSNLLPAPHNTVPDSLFSVAERTALLGLDKYDDVEVLMRSMAKDQTSISETSLAEGAALLQSGAAAYPAFLAFWTESIAPLVTVHIAAWQEQDRTHQPLRLLTELHRLPTISEPTLPLILMPYHPAGSGTVSPVGLYTSLFRTPDLGWFLGHEATHILWRRSSPEGWMSHPLAAQAVALAEPLEVLVEELPCWLFQAAMSRECGISPPNFMISARFPDGPTKTVLMALEAQWPEYLSSPGRWATSIDFVLQTTVEVLSNHNAM